MKVNVNSQNLPLESLLISHLDSKIYIWHKENSNLVESLEGHTTGRTTGCVNAVAWNPKDPGMFASAGDDRKVRV